MVVLQAELAGSRGNSDLHFVGCKVGRGHKTFWPSGLRHWDACPLQSLNGAMRKHLLFDHTVQALGHRILQVHYGLHNTI